MPTSRPCAPRVPGARLALAALVLLAAPALGEAGKKKDPPVELTAVHEHPSGAFSFATPAGWTAGPVEGRDGLYEATDGTLVVRFVYRPQEAGFDSMHVDCMLERLAGPMDTEPQVDYEYDFLSGAVGDRQVLDSAFFLTYDQPVLGHTGWRQRNLTVVGAGESLCVITHAPTAAWKKSSAVRALVDAVARSVVFK